MARAKKSRPAKKPSPARRTRRAKAPTTFSCHVLAMLGAATFDVAFRNRLFELGAEDTAEHYGLSLTSDEISKLQYMIDCPTREDDLQSKFEELGETYCPCWPCDEQIQPPIS
jgi:hypothetical protein